MNLLKTLKLLPILITWLGRRALSNALDGYTPQGEVCPIERPSIRNGSALSTNETSWLEQRRNVTVDAMLQFLDRLDMGSLNASSYIEKNAANISTLPNIGIPVSGRSKLWQKAS
ncbi:lysophospholipase 2 [Penicillium angulare]|uniref:lysophospholipase 2 n=1 Tax=Penicillium angulare TaxID=116970 RepID=UPI0025422D01|nr:lysophospholipase 2 [Penicillium angulare]KAJ5280337.1 lysophospholipase 2 [Penicillium angulare]